MSLKNSQTLQNDRTEHTLIYCTTKQVHITEKILIIHFMGSIRWEREGFQKISKGVKVIKGSNLEVGARNAKIFNWAIS